MNREKMVIGILLALAMLFCSCAPRENAETSRSAESSTIPSETTIPTEENTTTEETTQAETENPAWAEYEQWVEEITNPLDGEGMIPLLFVDSTADAGRAYLICAGNNGEVYLADRFAYDGGPLYSVEGYGRLEDVDRLSTTKILDLEQSLQFIDPSGKSVATTADSMTTTGRIYASLVMAQAHLTKKLPSGSEYYVGSYQNAEMFPADALYTDNSISADLDQNGTADKIQWTLTEQEYVEDEFLNYFGYYYSYEVTAEYNGTTYTICSSYDDYDVVAKGDVQAFLADVDLDGMLEIVVYTKALLRFDSIYVYDYDGEKFAESLVYVISPMP